MERMAALGAAVQQLRRGLECMLEGGEAGLHDSAARRMRQAMQSSLPGNHLLELVLEAFRIAVLHTEAAVEEAAALSRGRHANDEHLARHGGGARPMTCRRRSPRRP